MRNFTTNFKNENNLKYLVFVFREELEREKAVLEQRIIQYQVIKSPNKANID